MAYATTTDLATYLGVDQAALTTDAPRLLDRASDLMDYVTHGGLGYGADYDAQQAAKKATCAQVEYWLQNGEELRPGIKVEGAGKTHIEYAGENSQSNGGLCLRARQALLLAGLLYAGVHAR